MLLSVTIKLPWQSQSTGAGEHSLVGIMEDTLEVTEAPFLPPILPLFTQT